MSALLDDKLHQLFSDPAERAEALRILDDYDGSRPERDRVQLATLKLAGADLSEIRRFTEAALLDYRDVLAWAEYPEQMQHAPGTANAEMRERDRAQYERWLRGDSD